MLQTRTSSSTTPQSITDSHAGNYCDKPNTAHGLPLHPPGLQALFNSLAHGVWVVDEQCHVHYANPVAQQTSKSARCLQLHKNLLQAVHKPDQLALEQSIQKATQHSTSGQSKAVRSVLRLRVIDTKPPTDLLILVTPLNDIESDHLLNACYEKYSAAGNKYIGLAAIQLQKTTLIDPAMLCLFALSYKLTNTEELVLSLLCDGLDAPEVAATLNVAVSTIRTHVRGLCAKMQANSIRQLIVRVALLPGAAGVSGIV